MSENNFQKRLLEELILLFDPVVRGAASPERVYELIGCLGWNGNALFGPPPNAVIDAWAVAASAVVEVERTLTPPPESLSDLSKSLGAVDAVSKAIAALPPAFGQNQPTELDSLVGDLFELLTLRYLRERAPAAVDVLRFLTIVRAEERTAVSKDAHLARRTTTVERLELDRIPLLLNDPVTLLRDHYFPSGLATDADTTLAARRIFPIVADLLSHTGARAIAGSGAGIPLLNEGEQAARNRTLTAIWELVDDPAVAVELGLSAHIFSAEEQGPGVLLAPFGAGELEFVLGAWRLALSLAAGAGALAIKSSGIETGLREQGFDAAVTLSRSTTDGSPIRFGSAAGTRFEVGMVSFTVEGKFHHPATGPDRIDYGGAAQIQQAALVISTGDGDGFLQKVMPAEGFRLEFNLAVGWSNQKGLYFKGGAGLEATLPINIDRFGVIKIDSVYLALLATSEEGKESKIQAVTATTVKVQLGPVSAVVERFGLQATLGFPEKGGNLGVANLDLRFKPPKGVGLTIKAQVVTGGGYLYFDFEKEQYAGVLQLEIAQKFSLSAVGILTTRMPDGSKGFSLLVVISVRFDPGIQLGYGFSLNGLGGLLGVNRTAMAEVLREGLRRGALGSVLFPQNIVENAPQIISNLSAIFPPAQDRFLFGPMAIIGWGGAPPILTMEIGIILELPEPVRLMILGRLRVTLPAQKDDSTQIAGASSGEQEKNQDTPKIKLQLDSLGIINFGTGDISLDAYLYDSTIGPFTITGGMALRASFGAKPLFLLSVGGFHPAFQAPAGFPSIERVALGLHKKESGLEVRLQLAAYFALTSNTVQFGAHLDLYVHVWEFEIVGLLGFDALIQFQPFGLIASFEAMVSVKAFGLTLMAVRLQVNATGPSPWHVWGKAQFTLLFFSGTAEFDALIGHEATPAPPPPIDVEQELFAELQKHSNWSSQLPEGEHPLVTFRDSSSSKDQSGTSPKKKVFIHPLADLHVNQRLVPLNSDPITRYGTTTPTGATTFMLEAKVDDEAVAASLLNAPPLSDWFARAQFYVMSDAEKLAAPSFEEKNSGIRVQAAEGYISGTPVGSVMKAAQTGKDGIQSNLEAAKFLDRVAHLGAAGQAPIRAAGPAKYGDPSWWDQGITLRKAGYRVVGEEDDGAAPKVRATRRGEASSPSSLFEEAKATVAEPVMSYSAARARATRARQRAPKRRTWVVPDIGVKRGDR